MDFAVKRPGGAPWPPLFRTPSSARSLATQFSKADSTAALNTSYFDPDAYLKRMLKETRLGDLTSKHRAMLAEVGSLDSDMQVAGLCPAQGLAKPAPLNQPPEYL
jgi:hypothetical protein